MISLRKKSRIDYISIFLIMLLIFSTGLLISTFFSTIEVFKIKKIEKNALTEFGTNKIGNENLMPRKPLRMSLTAFDKGIAKDFMDKNHDGKCDFCGMPVEQCIDSGQLQCNMDTSSTIGILGSAHIHSDFKVYIDGNPIDFANPNYYMKSSFMHLDDNPNKEDASGVLHMHATGTPLWFFFKSIGIGFNEDCIAFGNSKYCDNENKKLRFFANGKENKEFENYVFNDLDKILISYGEENGEVITSQLNSITSFAALH